jgi:Rps23 Pro-64 3,4-dihydroxylase Tpa1-like proline 4-hydroxylase
MERKINIFKEPFPHLIIENFYTNEELELIWEEFKFLTRPGKLYEPGFVHGAWDAEKQEFMTKSRSLSLDSAYNDKNLSNIITVTQKLFNHGFLNIFFDKFPQHKKILYTNYCITKARYYHNGDYYEPHTDIFHDFLAFSYFNKEPRKFLGGELFFPEYGDYEFKCLNNSLILLPSCVTHGVKLVSIDDEDYYSGHGRYCISHFFGASFEKKNEILLNENQ